jgi:hypothetical protein
MTVIAYREVLPRTFSHRFGESPTAERKFIVTVDEPTATQEVIDAVNIAHADQHPEFAYLRMLDASAVETDRHHVEITYRYEVPKQEDLDPNPLARPDVWSFSTGGAAVPALFYYHGAGNADIRPLINTAGDFIESAMTEESELRATISGNREEFPLAAAAAVTNAVNMSSYLGGAIYTWKCNGISAQQATEVVNGVEIRYWQVSVELAYRQSGWPLQLPNVGWSVWSESKQKKVRAYVFDDESGEKIASANPVALNENGTIRLSSDLQGSGRPDIIQRRVHPAVDFATYFGTPPF